MAAARRSGSRIGQNSQNLSKEKVLQFRVVLLGEAAVGKTSLVLRFVEGRFFEKLESTIGAAFSSQMLRVDDHLVKFEIWDTAGQERYHSLAPMYYRGAQAAIIVYDITDPQSFERAKVWARELHQQTNDRLTVALLGNKADLSHKRLVEFTEGETFSEESGYIFRETSAKTGQNVEEAFHDIARKLPRDQNNSSQSQNQKGIRPSLHDQHGRKCCHT